MLTRARQRAHKNPSPDPPLSSASQAQDPAQGSSLVSASASSSSDEYFSPPTSPTPVRRAGRRRPPTSLGARGQPASNGVPASGGGVQCMRWTQSINENVMRAYYGATEGGTNLTAYRVRMLSLFQALEPAINVSAQRLSDQVRVILRNNRLSDTVLDRIRSEMCNSGFTSAPSQPVVEGPLPATPQGPDHDDEDEGDMAITTSKYSDQLRSALGDAIREYRNTPAELRPRLPRLPMTKRNKDLVCTLDSLLADYFESSEDLEDTHSILFCAAVAACRVAGVTFEDTERATRPKAATPAWQSRIEKRINKTRVLIGKLYCFKEGNTRPRVMRFVGRAFLGTGISPQEYPSYVVERIDFLKQKVYAWASRIRRYRRRVDRYYLNRMFQSDQRWVYRTWERLDQGVSDGCRPDDDATNIFWRNIWSVPVDHIEGDWMREVRQACEPLEAMGEISIASEDVAAAVRSVPNWKSPGPDGLHSFWLKWLRSSHDCLASQFQSALESGSLPQFLTTGVTHLLHKSGSATDPKNYRPITCLPTVYKLLTSILRDKINSHIQNNSILSVSQNGCRGGSRGTKELLLIDMTISQQVRRFRKSLSTCWIDYKKAYDSVPHTWLLRVLELYKLDTTLCSFLRSCMGQWRTVLRYPGCRTIHSNDEPIRIERGIFQGDSLSPLWFCLALNPLNTLLECSRLGYCLWRGGKVISHLLYMDDLKLFAPSGSQLMELLKVTETFSNSIGMEFGVDKCAVMHVKRGEIMESDGLQLSDSINFRSLSANESYKYLGVSEALGINVTDMKQSLQERFFGRLKKVLKSLLSGGNKVRAFNGWVMPVLMYSFGILKWTQKELDALDRRVRVLLTAYRMHHPRSSVMRLYIPRRCGGRGFLNAKTLHNREVYKLREYFLHTDLDMHRDVVTMDKGLTPLSLGKENWRKPVVLSTENRKGVWKSKELHGRFYRALHGPGVDFMASVSWLRFGNLFGETEGFLGV
nr:uncharacterized protein LOC113392088 [Vanessa tameamea]